MPSRNKAQRSDGFLPTTCSQAPCMLLQERTPLLAQVRALPAALPFPCWSGPVRFSARGDMAAAGHGDKRGQTRPEEVGRLLRAWQGARCFLQKNTKSLPTGFVPQQRALLQSCVGVGRNKCPRGCCEEHTSEQLLSLLSNLNFN